MSIVRIFVEHDDLLPRRATPGSSGFDLKASVREVVPAHTRAKIATGVRLEMPLGIEGHVRPRSGMSFKGYDVKFGSVDSDYRGEVGVILENTTDRELIISRGDRIAQLVFCELPAVSLERVTAESMSTSTRGVGGFGSTGDR